MPRLLDLFCGAGGCSVGYARAGWEVTGVDLVHHDSYPDPSLSFFGHGMDVDCLFVQADALEVLRDPGFLAGFDAYAASPPCPFYSTITPEASRSAHPDLIPVVRELLAATGKPYVIENVEGAARSMPGAVRLCGSWSS
jgi:DNA (cytosine-5)-methyltransferase 1